MTESIVLDVVLIVVLLAYIVYGIRFGLSRSIFVIAGVIVGILAALFLTPIVSAWVPWPAARPILTIVVALLFVGLGHALGGAIGRAARRGVSRSALSGIDRLLGGIATGIVAALVASMVAFSVGQLGVPVLSRAIAGSTVLRTIQTLTPDPVQAFMAQMRGLVTEAGQPIIVEALGGNPPAIPQIDAGSPALNAAAQSVVRITGNAYECGQAQSGTGFVIADDRVVTNAHVVAGVGEPVIESLDGETLIGRVVYFDAANDLAVIAVAGLSAPALPTVSTIAEGTDAAVQGYPHGGPFVSGGATVISVGTPVIRNIYGTGSDTREVYTLAADVREGNSGGPLLTLDGRVAGIVFARSGDSDTIGYAMTMTLLQPLIDQATGLTTAVVSGECIRS